MRKPTPARIHAALTAGLLSHIGLREGDSREYAGARNTKFVLAPGSVLTKRPPRWIVVAELVETSRLYGRIAARIEPEAVERVAGASGAAHLQRTALGRPARSGHGLRAGDAVRPAAGAAPPRRLRPGRAGARPRAVHPARARRGRLADPPSLLPRQRPAARGTGRDRRARTPPRPDRRRRRDLRLLRRPHPGRRRLGAALRRLVEEAAAPHAGPADVHPRRPAAHRRCRRRPAGHLAGG